MTEKVSQMEKEIPVDIKEVGDKEEIREEVEDIKSPITEDEALIEEDVIEQEERVDEVKDSVIELKNILNEFLQASFKIELSEDDMKLLLQKILGVVNVFVADTTTDRVQEIAGDIVQTTEDQLKVEKDRLGKVTKAFGVKYPEHPKIMNFLLERFDEFLSREDAVSQVGQVFEVSRDVAEEAVRIIEEEKGQLTSMEVEERVDEILEPVEPVSPLEPALQS